MTEIEKKLENAMTDNYDSEGQLVLSQCVYDCALITEQVARERAIAFVEWKDNLSNSELQIKLDYGNSFSCRWKTESELYSEFLKTL